MISREFQNLKAKTFGNVLIKIVNQANYLYLNKPINQKKMMMNEATALLTSEPSRSRNTSSMRSDKTKKSFPWTNLLGPFLVAGLLLISGVKASKSKQQNHNPKLNEDKRVLNTEDACVTMCTGVYTSTCIAFGNENLPLPSGIMSANAISVPSTTSGKDGTGTGIDYYLLSTDPDYLGLEWREHGHYTLQKDKSPSPLENCAGSLDLEAWDGQEWIPFQFDMEWNTNDDAKSFYLSTSIGFNCHYVKIYGDECRAAYSSIVDAFLEKDITPLIPSIDELCTSSDDDNHESDDDSSSSSGEFVIPLTPASMLILSGVAFFLDTLFF